MMYGNIDDPRNPFIYHPAIVKALAALKTMDYSGSDFKEVPIDGTLMFARIITVNTKPLADVHPEIHEHYVDLHYSLAGSERLCFSLKTPPTVFRHDVANDHLFYDSFVDCAFVDLSPGDFAVFFPEDIHAAGVAADQPASIRKAIVKLSLDLFSTPLA